MIFLVVRRVTSHAVGATIASLSFLTIPFTSVWAQYDRVDMLALALSWCGLWCVVRQGRAGAAAVALLVASSFTRQTGAIAGAVGAYFWLAREKGLAEANRLAFYVASAGLAGTMILNATSDGGFLFHIIKATAGPVSVSNLVNQSRQPVELMPLFLLCAAVMATVGSKFSCGGGRSSPHTLPVRC